MPTVSVADHNSESASRCLPPASHDSPQPCRYPGITPSKLPWKVFGNHSFQHTQPAVTPNPARIVMLIICRLMCTTKKIRFPIPLRACLAPCLSLGFSASRSVSNRQDPKTFPGKHFSHGGGRQTPTLSPNLPGLCTETCRVPAHHPEPAAPVDLFLDSQHGQKSSLVVRVTVAVSTAPTTPRS
jgi:hypothetical protein